MKSKLKIIIGLPMLFSIACKDGRTEQLKRIADKIEYSDSERISGMKKFNDSLDKATKVKVDSIVYYFNKSMNFSMEGKSDSCKKYLKIMQEYSRKN